MIAGRRLTGTGSVRAWSTSDAAVELPADFATLLIADENSQADLGRLVRIDESTCGAVCAYRYSNPRQEHCFFFAHQPGPWALGAWASDGGFLYWSFDREREAVHAGSVQWLLRGCRRSPGTHL